MKEIIISFLQYFVVIGGQYSFAYYYDKINTDIPGSITTLSIVSSINLGIQLLFGIISSHLIDRIGYFFTSLLAFNFVGIAFISTSFINDINLMYLTYGLVAAMGYSMLITMCITIIMYRYNDGPYFSRVMGFCSLGAATGLMGLPFLIQYMDLTLGLPWRTNMRYVGIGICGIGILLCVLMRPGDRPGDRHNIISSELPTTNNGSNENKISLSESVCYLLKNYRYMLYAISISLYGTIHSVFFTYIIIYMTYNGDSEFKKTFAIPIVGLGSAFGRVATGFLAKFYPRFTFSACLICVSSAYFITSYYDKIWSIYVVAAIIGFFGEASFVCYYSAILKIIDSKYANYSNGLTTTIRAPITIGLFIGLGYLYDVYGYYVLWMTCAFITLFSFLLSLITFI
jgi:MFS family permease